MPKIRFFTQADNQAPKAQKIPPTSKAKYRLTNWPEYNKSLMHRGSFALWIDPDTLDHWYYEGPRTSGGVLRYSDQCIQAALSLKAAFGLAFRQTQGLIQSILDIMKKELQVPSYTQLCHRQAGINAFVPPAPPSESACGPIYIALDNTGLKVYGEGDGAARAVEGEKTWS